MDQIAATTSTPTTSSATVTAPEEEETRAAISSDFDTFLSLLTAQLRNQDPTNPIDSTEFVAQLAQFSAVEQQVIGNEKLDKLVTMMAGGDAQGLASWIGTHVQGARSITTEGGPVDTFVDVPGSADYAIFRVFDSAGTLVSSASLTPGTRNHSWDGKNLDNEDAGAGTYRFEVETYEGGTSSGLLPVEVFGPVREARLENGETILILEDGTRKPASDVAAVRAPEDAAEA